MRHIPSMLVLLVAAQCALSQTSHDTTMKNTDADTVRLMQNYGLLSVGSQPEGVEIYDDSLYLGRTPIVRVAVPTGRHFLRLFYPGARIWNAVVAIDSISVRPYGESSAFLRLYSATFSLTPPAVIDAHVGTPTPELSFSRSHTEKLMMECIAGGAMVLSGSISAYLKTNSDNKFNTYLTTRDPAILDRVHRLDTWAGVCLVVTEVSFAVLTYLFLSN